jgi:2-desacetyl-2-hydroxyethyl bacteriochlorophyllide A dehydrogenase
LYSFEVSKLNDSRDTSGDPRRAVVFTDCRRVGVHDRPAVEPDDERVRVETDCSAISAGTELLVYRDEVPAEMPVDASLPAFADDTFGYPLQYGYAAVGTVVETGAAVEDDWVGERVFAFNPHETEFLAEPSALLPVPDDLSTEAATLFPTVETATTLVHDLAPRLGERIVVFGAGAVGLSVVALLATFPLAELVVVEPVTDRRERAAALGADTTLTPDSVATLGERQAADERAGMDGAVEISGNPAALDDAVSAVGYDGRVIVGSWYGTKRADLDLGGTYHRSRIDIESSQVSSIDPGLRGRWTKSRRAETALARATELPLETVITHRIPFEDAPRAYDLLDNPTEAADRPLQILLTYE